MRKILERCNKAIRRLGDEGFSLVELIIVIAIMVALVAILAPQYFQYIEKSRKSIDISAANDILTATKVAAIDPDIDAPSTFTVVWASTGASATGAISVTGDTAGGDILAAVTAAVGTTIKPVSNYAEGAVGFQVAVTTNADTGAYVFTPTTNWIEGSAEAAGKGA